MPDAAAAPASTDATTQTDAPEPTAGQVADRILAAKGGSDPKAPTGAPSADSRTATSSAASDDTGSASAKNGTEPKEDPKAAAADGKKKPRVGPDLERIAKKDRELLDRDESLKAREAKVAPIEQALEKRDLIGVLQAGGFSLEDINAAFLKIEEERDRSEDPKVVAERTVEARLAAEKKAAEDAAKKDDDERYAKAKASFMEHAQTTVAGDPEKYELLTLNFGPEAAAEEARILVEDLAQEGKRVTTVQALEMLEEKLFEIEKAKHGKSKKLAALWAPATSAAGPGARDANTNGSGRAATPSLSNRTTAGNPVVAPVDDDDDDTGLSTSQAVARALARARAKGHNIPV